MPVAETPNGQAAQSEEPNPPAKDPNHPRSAGSDSPSDSSKARSAGSDPRPEDEVREIERETDHLARTIDHAREAVLRAHHAGSLSSEGEEYGGYSGEAAKPPEALEEGAETDAAASGGNAKRAEPADDQA